MVFIVLRQQASTIQAILTVEPVTVSKKMVRFTEGIHPESIVLVEGVFQKPIEEVKSCSVGDLEIKVHKVRSLSLFLSGGEAYVRHLLLPRTDSRHF